ncbi:MAG: polysaccharide deacetylase family protein [Lacibacter sp.]
MIKKVPPVVMLHHVSDDPSHESLKPYSISHKSFLQLLDYLDIQQYQTVTFADLVHNRKLLPSKRKKVILTFDDCPKHLLDFALPELMKRKMRAVFYMPTAHLGGYNDWDAAEGRTRVELMNEADLKELCRMGMEVGAHAHHHIKLKEAEASIVRNEVITSKKILEAITGETVCSFAYPFGSVPAGYKQILSSAGYSYASSIFHPFENAFALRRFIYHDGDTNETLRKKLSLIYRCYRMVTDAFKSY